MRRKTILTFFFLFCIVLSYAQTANFTAATTSGCSPLIVNFQDQSSGNISSWFWDFGNGATSTQQNPSTTYFTPGTYAVTLTVTNTQGKSNTLTRNQFITVYGKPSVNFITNDSSACFPLRAQFTDLSSPSAGTSNTTWLWDFGDGTQSTQQNPLHVYTNSGNYTVNLKVTSDKGCYAVFVKQSYIKVAGGVTSDFNNTQPTICRPPYNISFTSNATGPGTLTWFWDFGDGTSSTQQNPVHTYNTPGNYTVAFATTSSDGCSDTMRKVSALNLLDIKTTFAAPDSICVNGPASFSNTSTPVPAGSLWNFGDGNTSTNYNPIKSYSTPGIYTVKLYNTYSYCSDSVSKLIKVLTRPVASFTANTTFKCQPDLVVNFQDQSTNAVGWFWDFGDSTTSTLQNPSHTYKNYGSYNVQLVVTNSSGCSDTLKKTKYINITRPVITFPALPVESCIPYSLAAGATISTVDAVTSYLWNFGDGATSTATNPLHTYPNQGTYTVSLTITTSTGCTETYALPGAVKVGRVPIIDFNGVPNPVCAKDKVQFTDLTNEGDTWFWEFGDGGSSPNKNPSYQYSDTGLFSVKLTVTNNGCKTSLVKPDYIRVKPPIARFEFTANCDNRLLFNFEDRSIYDPSIAVNWLWDFGDGTTSTQQNPVHTFPSLGTYNVTLNISNGSCTNSITKSVQVIKEKTDFHATFTTACRQTTFYFYGDVANPVNIKRYFWDFGDGVQWDSNISNSGNYAYHYFPYSGYYTVTLITTDIYGCNDTTIKKNYIRINGPLTNFYSSNNAYCKGIPTSFNDISQNDGISNIISWKWDFGDGVIQTLNSGPFQHTYSSAGLYTVKLTITDSGGCSDSLERPNYIIVADPKAQFSSSDTLSCPGSTVQFTNQSNAISFISLWSFGDGNNSSATSPTNIYTNTGLYTVKLKITDQYGCSDSITKPNYIQVNKPVASYTVNDSVSSCTPFEVDFTNTSQYYISSHWDLGGGVSTLKNPIQFYNAPGIYPIQLIVTSPGGCQDTTYGTVHVYDTVGSKITYTPLDGCKPLNVNLDAFSPGPATYTWDFGDGILITNDTTKMNHVYNFFGKFVPKIILTDPAGCIIPISGLDTIRIKGATVKFGLDNKFFCDSGLVTFIDSTTYNDSLMAYNWDFGDGTTSHLQNPSHFYSSPGFYTPSLNVQTENACVDTFRIDNAIKIVQSPLISIHGDSIICLNEFMQHLGVFDRSDTSAVQWAWKFPNGNTSSLQNPLPQQYTKAGNFVVSTLVTNSSGCKDTATKNILIHPLPSVTMPSAITMQVGFPITIPATYTSNVTSWTWSPDTTLNCGDCPQPVANPKFNTKYTVSFIDSNGCKNSGDIQIIVICKNANVFVPNTFSPNGDGNNDVFYVRGRGLDRVKSLRIFNRWGEVVFEQQNFPVNNAMYGWDGTYKGHKPVPDVYVYQVEVFCENSQVVHFEGNIALIQ